MFGWGAYGEYLKAMGIIIVRDFLTPRPLGFHRGDFSLVVSGQ